MAKQLLISVMEEVVGEYVLNISKENLKIAALRGKVKLENVQLDGDLIGSHVLGAVGLSGFGVLSCWAKSVKIVVPLKNLDKQPTRIEIQGVHLLCVPLLPSTAHRRYGAGTAVDPRCTLRTRAKRSALARFERNFFHGRIPGEGPPTRRMRGAMKLAERQLRKSKTKWRSKRLKDEDLDDEDAFSELESSIFGDAASEVPESIFMPSKSSWSVKLREKLLRNLEVSMVDMHVRCEVSEGGLDFSHPGQRQFQQKYGAENGIPAEQRAFSFGLTLESFVVRTAKEGQAPVRSESCVSDDSSTVSSRQQSQSNSLLSTSSGEVQNKMAEFNNAAFYWDDEPPLLLSESYILATNDHTLSPNRLQGRISAAMEGMVHFQHPGERISQSLMRPDSISPGRKGALDNGPKLPHIYCCKNLSAQVLVQLGDRNQPGPMTLLAEVLPLNLELQFRPNQFVQYSKLKSAMYSQQRFDTMLRQRPKADPMSQPRMWWKYVIACVTTSPHSRPWDDVVKIARSRARYIELVKKKINQSSEGNGFHGGLKDEESFELLGLEDLLPIEALQTFHLLALREVYAMRKEAGKDFFDKAENEQLEIDVSAQSKPRLTNPFRRSKKVKQHAIEVDADPDTSMRSSLSSLTKGAVYAAITARMGRKQWLNTFHLNQTNLSVVLVQHEDPIIEFDLSATGEVRTFGPGRRDFVFDVIHFEVIDPQNRLANFTPHQISDRGKLLMFEEVHRLNYEGDLSLTVDSAFSLETDANMEPPPHGVVCRLSATKDTNSTRLGISAHPATLVWSKPCMDAVAEFFSSPSAELQTEVTRQLRNVATPLARKALLALMSPSALDLRMNIAAPKVWFPVSGETSDGAVYFDAGKFIMSITKEELRTDTVWNLAARDIQMMFIRQSKQGRIRFGRISEKDAMSVIQPLQLHVEAILAERELALPRSNPTFNHMTILSDIGPWRKLDISVSPICLNLVDAEILAKAIGKWYASGLVRVKKRRDPNAMNDVPTSDGNFGNKEKEETLLRAVQMTTSGVGILSVHVERFEMALEGHSKRDDGGSNDERSVSTFASFSEYAEPRIRTYVVELIDINIGRLSQHGITRNKFLVSDIRIVRVKEDRRFNPLLSEQQIHDLPHCILVRLDKDYLSSPRETNGTVVGAHPPTQLRLSGADPFCQQSPFRNLQQAFDKGPITDIAATDNASSFLSVSFLHDKLLHLDEVEIDINSIVLRVTPITLKDCSKGFSKVMELIQVVTRELERKVHEEGRKARLERLDATGSQKDSSIRRNPAPNMESDRAQNSASDSSILFKVTLHDMTLLAGRPLRLSDKSKATDAAGTARSHAVVQVVANALFMFQSVENGDGSGSKTLHASVDNLSASANTEFDRLSPKVAPMIGPTAAEFRIVYGTENLGSVVSQDISLDCEALKASLTPNDAFIIKSVGDSIRQRLQRFVVNNSQSEAEGCSQATRPRRVLLSLVRFQRKGAGIATAIRFEIQHVSFVLLEAFRSKQGTRPLFDLRFSSFKGRFNGCMTALSGECNASISVNHYNADLTEWESTIEPVNIDVSVEQMPDELLVNVTTTETISTNVTSVMLKDYIKIDFSILKAKSDVDTRAAFRDVHVDPTTLTTIGLRRATEGHTVLVRNHTGLDMLVSPSVPNAHGFSSEDLGDIAIGARCEASIDVNHLSDRDSGPFSGVLPKLKARLAQSAVGHVGEREPLVDLPVSAVGDRSTFLHRLLPAASKDGNETVLAQLSGRCSPDTVFSENSRVTQSEYAYYNAEPVVEWCMQNQRLRASITDCYSLSKGRDLLSSRTWSPGDEIIADPDQSLFVDMLGAGQSESEDDNDSYSLPKKVKTSTTRPSQHSNWVTPYLKNDSPEWTDMTCILRMARERVMLPDNNWIWLNDWTVDLSGVYGETTDCDGWEYEADFETFNRHRRFYKRGDSCRRRRWTRTRMIRPPPLSDPLRPLFLVWETMRDSNDNYVVTAKSHVTLHNNTSADLSVFVSSPSWEEIGLGIVNAGDCLPFPIQFATATFVQLGIPRGKGASKLPTTKKNMSMSRRIMIVPTGNTSSALVRTVINVKRANDSEVFMGLDTDRSVHLLIQITSVKGIVDVRVEPVLRIVNLLPCQLECEVGEVNDDARDDLRRVIGPKGRKISSKEHLVIQAGAEAKGVGVNPCLKPHISLRLPSYHWSSWHRIVNGKSSSCTWQPVDTEEEWHMNAGSSDADYADEFKSIVFFERRGAGDPLNIIISVEMGHCPTLRVYAQYWILDKTGFGCRFCDSFSDMLGASPDAETSRRSHLLELEANRTMVKEDRYSPGVQWAIGKDGMTLYFSRKEKIALSIECGTSGRGTEKETSVKSCWVSPLDISNVIPKTIFSVDEYNGYRRFELAVSVNVCPSIFSRTKLITLFPRYQIVNLLDEDLIVAQDGWQKVQTCIQPRSSVPFHWERQSLPPRIRLGRAVSGSRGDILWTNGCIQLDKIGITSMRLPLETSKGNHPIVVQAEVRLATKEQSSAVVVVIWSTNEMSNALYVLRNNTSRTILCRQPLQDDVGEEEGDTSVLGGCTGFNNNGEEDLHNHGFECGSGFGQIIGAFLGFDLKEEFVWVVRPGENIFFGFDDPEKLHILEWTVASRNSSRFDKRKKNAFIEIDAMGSFSILPLDDGTEIRCQIGAEHSTKVIEFTELGSRRSRRALNQENMSTLRRGGKHYEEMLSTSIRSTTDRVDAVDDDDNVSFSVRISLPTISISVIDNGSSSAYGREILLAQLDSLVFMFAQNYEGYHEMELTLMTLQVDNHVQRSIHPVLVFCPRVDVAEPLLHVSAVRRLQPQSTSLAFRYVAIRLLDIEIYLDRRTAENIASFIQPLGEVQEDQHQDPKDWIVDVTSRMSQVYRRGNDCTSSDVDAIASTAHWGRIYIEQLHLHPVRIGLTFTQEWMEWTPGAEGMMIFQFIRGMASIANAPLKFTSFVVGHVFESPQALARIVGTHYSSQLTKQIFGILGSLAILGAPADFISNVGTGVRDFFYEPINGLVHGPAQFVEGLEAGTQSLARGVFVGVVRGAANVTEVVNSNLAGLTADDQFLDERKAHQRMLTDAMSRGETNRDFRDSLCLAGASIGRGVRSGAYGIWEQPAHYASKHGPLGFVKGVGKALVGAIVKPVVGVGDAAVLVMNHVSDATSDRQIIPKIPKRLRRALPRASKEKVFNVRIFPYDDRAAKAQQIVTGGESLDDVYIGHVNIPSHLIIASDRYLLALDNKNREPWRVSWEEISHFGMQDNDKMRITVFGQTGLRSFVFEVDDSAQFALFHKLLAMQASKMGNGAIAVSGGDNKSLHVGLEDIFRHDIPGIKVRQVKHVFGSSNNNRRRLHSSIKDEIDVIEQCFARVKKLGSHSPEFFKTLDEEAWSLINSWGQVFSGLSSRRCIVASIINGTGFDIQIKSTKLVEGGSPCYSIPSKEFDAEQGVLHPGGVIIFFGWGVVPNLLQAGNVFMSIETNAFVTDLSDQKGRETFAETMPDYHVGFLEKSYDESGWWAKYWLLVRKTGRPLL